MGLSQEEHRLGQPFFRNDRRKRSLQYAQIIIDISTQALDRIFTYRIPEELSGKVVVGAQVRIPFGQGNRERMGYVMGLTDFPGYEEDKIKEILSVEMDAHLVESQLLRLAYWMKEQYGATLVQALATVLPFKSKTAAKQVKYLELLVPAEEAGRLETEYEKKHYVAKVRLLHCLKEDQVIEKQTAIHALHIPDSTIKALCRDQVIKESSVRSFRNPETGSQYALAVHPLNEEQQAAYEHFRADYENGKRGTYLLYGVTGSGKTEVYLQMIEYVLSKGKDAIVLIPEIALTYQTVRRFSNRFGEQVTVIHSRLSKGERYDQFERAKNGQVKVVIGPRSALFVPLKDVGLIIMDEEHESSYKSDNPPKYHARETAIERARLSGASVVLGSATPSIESFYRAEQGMYTKLTLSHRAAEALLPKVEVVDMRQELKAGNFSMFSRSLAAAIEERLYRKEQSMLFINRRGYAGFVSCRNCGYVVKCSHCDVSLKLHGKTRLICHYCGHEEALPRVCPSCGSSYIRAFGTGTEKVEEELKKRFPSARVLRMDADTTRKKGGHDAILKAFANQEADILVGTQMIVKGHDFSNVTLVGALAADMSLFEQDFRAAEKTYDLLTQAAGRAGRAEKPGEMIIQTYQPEQYSIKAAAYKDYEAFYKEEIAYRRLLSYPPAAHMLVVFLAADTSVEVTDAADRVASYLKEIDEKLMVIGPSEASIYKVQDVYRKLLYIKHKEYARLVMIKDRLEALYNKEEWRKRVRIYFDFDPMTMY